MADAPEGTTGRLAGRIGLITGASRGIGRAVAVRFAREGALVVLLARTLGALEEVDDEIHAAGGQASLVPGDLTNALTIDKVGAAIYERWGRLDILVGNAGELGVLSPVGHIDPAVWDKVIAVNLTANWRLLRACDPLLRMAEAGRAVFVTAAVAPGRAYWGPYAASKAGLESLVRSYAHEVQNTPVRANLIDPGPTRTRLRATAFPGEAPESLKPPEAVTDAFLDLVVPGCERNGEVVRV